MYRKHACDKKKPRCQVTDEAQARLHNSAYGPVRQVACAYDGEVLILRGQLKTFFHKQVAQEAVANVAGVRQVVNEIVVVHGAN